MTRSQEYIEWLKRLGNETDVFYFKQFHLKDDRSTMKVGTDAVLLGIAADVTKAKTVLEVGTGSGVISLILAQRSDAIIEAIDIDEDSITQARENVDESPWKDRIRLIHTSLQDHLKHSRTRYDLIASNPPYFSRSFKSGKAKRNLSRHDDSLTFDDLLKASGKLLTDRGQLWVILPTLEGSQFRNKALVAGFHLLQILQVIPKAGKDANRAIMGFSREKADKIKENTIILRDENNEFSTDYMAFAHDFYIDF